jgi:putative transposase
MKHAGDYTVGVAPARPAKPVRKDHHLAFELYSGAGAYFVTICSDRRLCIFSEIVDGAVSLQPLGKVLESRWLDLPNHHQGVDLDYYVVMPNHFHAVLFLNLQAGLSPELGRSNLAVIINSFKSSVTRTARKELGLSTSQPLLQRNYHERIVRDERELWEIRNYIVNNPLQWHLDRENPDVSNAAAGRAGATPTSLGNTENRDA